jgi:putative phosphoesterase
MFFGKRAGMLIGILSDTHSNYAIVKQVRDILDERKINEILHCGDIEDAETVYLLEGLSAQFVLGNCDFDTPELRQAIQDVGGILHDGFGHIERNRCNVAWIHGHEQGRFRDLVNAQHFDFIFYGHTHRQEQHRTGKTEVINPGALYRAKEKSFAILDTKSRQVEIVVVEQRKT